MLAAWISGFIAAEGCFTATQTPSHRRYGFQVGLGAADRQVCELFLGFFGVGRLVSYRRRQPHYDDEVAFVVSRMPDLIEVVVPFVDAHLPECHKRMQYQAWRADLFAYWNGQARRRRPCRIDGCSSLAVAYGLCRPHLWREEGR